MDELKLINCYYCESLSVNLATMKPETKERVQVVVNILKTGFNWGFIPVVIILGNIYINALAGPFQFTLVFMIIFKHMAYCSLSII